MSNDNPMKCPFVVAIDSREQQSYSFDGFFADSKHKCRPLEIETQVLKIDSGDYSIISPVDLRERVSVERKSPEDFVNTIIRNRSRFTREMARLQLMDSAHIVVESEWSIIKRRLPSISAAHFKSVYRSVIAYQIDFPKVHWHFIANRQWAEATTFRILQKFWERYQANNN